MDTTVIRLSELSRVFGLFFDCSAFVSSEILHLSLVDLGTGISLSLVDFFIGLLS